MKKLDVILVMLNENALNSALKILNFDTTNLVAVLIENGDGRILTLNDKEISTVSFTSMQKFLNRSEKFVWLLSGFVNQFGDLWRMKKFLINGGVPADNIVNFEIAEYVSYEWIANLRYIEEYGADFFTTGISYTEVGLNLNFIPHMRGRGINLSGSNQDLRQSYLTAKHVFEHVKPGTIKFVLIGLAPYSFRYDNAKAFSVCSHHLQYMLVVNAPERNFHDQILKVIVNDNCKNIFMSVTSAQADLNFERVKISLNRELPAKAVIDWEDELKNLTKNFYSETVAENFQILKDYIKLCLDNGAKPVGVVFPFAPAMHNNYSAELLTPFRMMINQLEESYDFTCVDLFDLGLGYDCFYNMAHLNLRGSAITSSILGMRLYEENILSIEDFCAANYECFLRLANVLDKDDYNEIMSRVFAKSAELIRRKDKIKVGFVLYDSSMWCGDDLYNLFARDAHFEPTIFLCLRTDKIDNELVRKDFLHGVEQFKSHGLNVVGLSEKNSSVPAQDVLIFITPYLEILPEAFDLSNITAKTLTVHLPYSFTVSRFLEYFKMPIMEVAWKVFSESKISHDLLEKHCEIGAPRGYFSGYPRMDIFFKDDAQFHFNWKMIRPDAKKIIYAPHWSINGGVNYATFQWNYQFMYEFAKSHPEISWVVKPHPNLLYSAVNEGLFPSIEDFNAYLQKWNDLPNAQVYTGAYYQAIFVTSDGMIHDSGSFIAEYQYVNKPMIFLTREGEEFNEFGEAILNVAYCIDGQDLNGIAALMQKVFIQGKDTLADKRKKFFDKNLNHIKANGMTASEFIYKSIADEVKEAST